MSKGYLQECNEKHGIDASFSSGRHLQLPHAYKRIQKHQEVRKRVEDPSYHIVSCVIDTFPG